MSTQKALDGRIGIIIRNGKKVYYAFQDLTKFNTYIERKTPEQVLAVLDGRKARVQRLRPVHRYKVTVTVKYPSCDDKGTEIEVLATNAKDAISNARHVVFTLGYYDRFDGAKSYKAKRND